MTDKVKAAFDGIRAEAKLKSDTVLYLQQIIAGRKKTQSHPRFNRYAVAFASVILLFISGVFTYHQYFTTTAYVDVDVNPAIALMLNPFNRVIGAQAYNNDGDAVLSGLSLTHKPYADALYLLMEAMTNQGYFQKEVLLSVTLQTANKNKENRLLDAIQTGIEKYMVGHRQAAQIDIFSVSSDTRSHSHEQGVSPAKYLAIQALMAVDPTASVANCRDHSISEIKQLTQVHGSHHDDGGEVATNEDTTNPAQGGGHHGGNNEKGRHGNGH